MHRWIRFALWNLCLVALLGLVLRYKIMFRLPFIEQKHLLHGHSHFAFSGWVTQCLMALLVTDLYRRNALLSLKKYHVLLGVNLFCAFSMLIGFLVQGYGLFSIFFSTCTILVSYIFAIMFWKDLGRLPVPSVADNWYRASLVFAVISSAGAFNLAYLMATQQVNQHGYLASLYFFLHFQYNGWFLFACIGLAFNHILGFIDPQTARKVFWSFAAACIPTYLLSALWLKLPFTFYLLAVAGAIIQLYGWWLIVRQVLKNKAGTAWQFPATVKWLFMLCSLAFSIKLMLQLGSTIPSLSDLAFGFRPIVIGYLHLILLGVITLFLLAFIIYGKFIPFNKTIRIAINTFVAGVLLNEILLFVQGTAAISYTPVAYINEMLLVAAAIMFTALLVFNIGIFSKTDEGHSS